MCIPVICVLSLIRSVSPVLFGLSVDGVICGIMWHIVWCLLNLCWVGYERYSAVKFVLKSCPPSRMKSERTVPCLSVVAGVAVVVPSRSSRLCSLEDTEAMGWLTIGSSGGGATPVFT